MFETFIQTLSERRGELLTALVEHLGISLLSLAAAVAIAVPLAVWLSPKKRAAEAVLQMTNVLQTIPSLALLGLLIPLVGIGTLPALIALTLYALLPIFQNTYLGLSEIDPSVKEAETAFGLSRVQQLWRVELPIALPAIISGIRTAAVLISGTATLAALIGAGGLGSLILLGIDRHNMALTFIGAALSALLAVGVSGLIALFARSRRKTALLAGLALLAAAFGLFSTVRSSEKQQIVIAGKLGSEPDILINLYKQLIESADPQAEVVLKPNFGKTTFLFNALNSGEIDIYPEFTGTVLESLVKLPEPRKAQKRTAAETYETGKNLLQQQFQLTLLPPMRYQNTYALAVPEQYAAKYGLEKISDLAKVKANIRAGFTLEFTDRPDGGKGLAARGINIAHVSTVEPALRYTALQEGRIDLIDAYSTDSEIRQYRLKMLHDDLQLFPPYQGAPLMKSGFAAAHPEVTAALNRLAGKISEAEMIEMNDRVKRGGEKPADVARDYLKEQGLVK
ncbi:ABC transporter permease/substrate-binding protein [Neisseria chenwenguii]|uniref:ABC transporter permease/substrate-binding protein n=1 Tax=Neisseria chenwenguii TaxID=1853278 RepID=UPI000F4E2663|nr:ABC transporter permease/substrate-binding protein [Neisseria chenwenguii]ROV55825.1 ABC transporter permease/substrate-binding protein [Neisseria chenwenguii]